MQKIVYRSISKKIVVGFCFGLLYRFLCHSINLDIFLCGVFNSSMKMKTFYQPDLFDDSIKLKPQEPKTLSRREVLSEGYDVKRFLVGGRENIRLSYVDNLGDTGDNSLDCQIIEKVVDGWKV